MRFRNVGVASAAAIKMLAAGCSSGSSNNPAPLNVEKTDIVVDAFPAIDSAGLYIAQMDGLFADQGRSEVFLHYEVYREPDRELAMDYFVWVARNADRTVLIDCGFNEQSGARRNRTMLCPPVEALRQIGVDAAEVSQLVVTHAHYDHIGKAVEIGGHAPGQGQERIADHHGRRSRGRSAPAAAGTGGARLAGIES
jgi:hypothetical protein